jgi:glycerophosphoryl diester phosphodiesterase
MRETNLMKLPFDRPININHRGTRSLVPENSLLSLHNAYDFGEYLWELDTAMTSDNAPVVIREDTLHRTSNTTTVFQKRSP